MIFKSLELLFIEDIVRVARKSIHHIRRFNKDREHMTAAHPHKTSPSNTNLLKLIL